MPESTSGIRYVPKHKRRQRGGRPERLHGAFSGGFSAGYFNTVGSPEGFQPKEMPSEATRAEAAATSAEDVEPQQKLEDFMDEHDHNEWGGPRNVRQDLVGRTLATDNKKDAGAVVNSASLLTETVFASDLIPSKNVGSRLLQKLGWREGSSTAFVPGGAENSKQQSATQHDNIINDEETQFLSQRRLKKIRVQQERITIPRPKLDQVGLGFEAYANAPEFQAFRDKRRRLAQERARGDHRSVYRISNLLGDGPDDDDAAAGATTIFAKRQGADRDDRDHNYESYEVMEDFVGSRTVGGFALHDDEDDAFDDHNNTRTLTKVSDKIMVDKEEYNTVIEDPHSDDDDDHHQMRTGGAQTEDLAKGFMAWTDATSTAGRPVDGKPAVSLTTDGRPPLAGFILGSSGGVLKRFRGPDIPDHYQVEKHVFRDEEHPLVWKTLARAVQLENDAARKESAVKDALEMNRIQKKVPLPTATDNNAPMAGDAFASLASAMKNRFISGKADNIEDRNSTKLAAGLTPASVLTKKTEEQAATTKVPERKLSVVRTVKSFAPATLLCKRWHIRAPTLNSNAVVPKESFQPSKEEVFFQKEVMTAARNSKTNASSSNAPQEYEEVENDIRANRPPMDVYRSIFGAVESEGEDDDDDGTNGEDHNNGSKQTMRQRRGTEEANSLDSLEKSNGKMEADSFGKKAATGTESKSDKHKYTWSSDSSVDESEEDRNKKSYKDRAKEKKKKEHRKKKKKHRKRDRSDEDVGDDDDDAADATSDKKSKRRKRKRKEERKQKDKKSTRKSRDAADKAEVESY